jgi:hypothetical protein
MRALSVLVFLSVAALACANLKDIGIVQRQHDAAPLMSQRLFRPLVNFPCSNLGATGSTCVYHRLCVSLSAILKSAGLLLLLRAAALKFQGEMPRALKVTSQRPDTT